MSRDLRSELRVVGRIMLAIAAVLAIAPATAAEELTAEQKQELKTHFGFAPLEIFKLDFGIAQLRPADFNNDGLMDFCVSNNNKSTIEVMLQRKSRPAMPDEPSEINDLVNDWRFERKPVSVTWAVACLAAGDVTGDGNADLVFFGDPAELVVFPGEGDGSFGEAMTRRVRDGFQLPAGLDLGDLNGDGRTDIALLAEHDIIIFFQPAGGGLGRAKRFSHASDTPGALKLPDLDGDGRDDLVLFTGDEDFPLHIQYQDSLGHLGPVQRVKLPALRSGYFAPCLGRKQADLFGVERVSGRLKRWSFDRVGATDSMEEWAVLFYPLPGDSSAERLPFALGDVDGNGQVDVVSADVEAAQLVLFLQQADVGLLPAKLFGGQIKMRDLKCFDADGNGVPEVYVLSAEEEAIARSVYEQSRLQFPKPLAIFGKPFAMDLGRLRDRGKVILAYVTRDEESDYHLVIQNPDAPKPDSEGGFRSKIEDLEEPPSAVRLADVNQDGRTDVLIFVPYEALITYLQGNDGSFTRLSKDGAGQTGLVKDAAIEGFSFADTTGDGVKEVLLAQGSFVRALHVNGQGDWEIIDQYNAPGADAEIAGVCTVPVSGGASRPFLAMYDRTGREVHFFAPAEGGTYELDRSVRVGSLDLKAMLAAPLGGSRRASVLLADKKSLAVILPGEPPAKVYERAVYESSIKDARLSRIASGDVNHDRRTDVAVLEVTENFVELLTFGPDEEFVRGNKFRVFAKKQFRGAGEAAEPRWVEIADLTNDGIDDLLLIAHDRVLLYPGE